DPRTKDLYVSEESRLELFKGVEPVIDLKQGISVSPPKPAEVPTDTALNAQSTGAGTRTSTVAQSSNPLAATDSAGAQVKPPPDNVKLHPGWFEVVGGDDVVKQIRFYKLGGERGAETTFGRASGRPYAHIQLKAPTVSSRQAKVAFDNGAAQLTNFAPSDSN